MATLSQVRNAALVTRQFLSRRRPAKPLYLIHSLTARCNAKCGFCAWTDYVERDALSPDQIRGLYRDARRAGFIGLSVWGGEPLLHPQAGELLAYAQRLGLTTNMVTNGALLPKRLDQVAPHLDHLCISVDHPSDTHDRIRGIPGLFGRIIDATREVRRRYPKVGVQFVCTLQRANCDVATVEAMARLTRELGVVGVYNAMRVDVAADTRSERSIAEYAAPPEAIRDVFEALGRLKRDGYPVLNSFTHLEKMQGGEPIYRCAWPKFMLPIEANGDVVDCMHWGTRPIGNVRDTPFRELLDHPRVAALAGPAGEACHKCVSVHRIEVSELWRGNLEPLASWWSQLN